jgi:transcriptional regulator with XRE-family HTH domain
MEQVDIPEETLREMFKIERLAQAGIQCTPPRHVVAETVRLTRSLAGWKQQALASLAGVSLSTIERIERGEPVSPESLDRVAIALGYKSGDFTKPRVPLTLEQCQRELQQTAKKFEKLVPVKVKPLCTQLQVAKLARTHVYLIDGDRLGSDLQDDVAALGKWLDFVSFVLTSEEHNLVIQVNRCERAKRRTLYTEMLNSVQNIERRGSAVALAGTYTAKTGAAIMPTVEVALIGFFPKRSDPGAVKRKVLLAPDKVDLGALWKRFCAQA